MRGNLLRIEEGRDGPALWSVGWLGEHESALVEEKDVSGVD